MSKKETTTTTKSLDESVISMRDLLEAGVHFGHQTRRWNPKMKPYIFTARNGIHVIDLQQTIPLINEAYHFIKDSVKKGGHVLFVGTKKQAQDAVKTEALRSESCFISNRWLGGFLTNFSTVCQSVNKLKKFQKEAKEGSFSKLSNKEASKKTKKLQRLNHYLGGVKDMISLPSVLFVVDTNKERLAIEEAQRKGIKVVAVVDTNANPDGVDFPIPGNDDAIRAVKLLCKVISDAVLAGKAEQVAYADEQQNKKK